MTTCNSSAFATLAPPMALALTSNFGSVRRWAAEVVEMAAAHDKAGERIASYSIRVRAH